MFFPNSNGRVAGIALVWWKGDDSYSWWDGAGWCEMSWHYSESHETSNLWTICFWIFFFLIYSDCGWPWATETVGSETTGVRWSLHSTETSDWGELRLCWCVLPIALYIGCSYLYHIIRWRCISREVLSSWKTYFYPYALFGKICPFLFFCVFLFCFDISSNHI